MDCKEAIQVLDELVFAKEGRHLDDAEIVVIEAAWLDKDYKEIASTSPFGIDVLQRRVAPKLWVLLTGILGNGEKVTKKRLRGILESRMAQTCDYVVSYNSNSSQSRPDNTSLQAIGGQPPDVTTFYGREAELTTLRELIVKNRCVALFGVAGIGKSALAAKLIEEIGAEPESGFDCFIWKSVHYAPQLQELVIELLGLLAVTFPEPALPESTHEQVSVLIERLHSRHCLLVLDGAEVLLQGDRNSSFNPYGDQYAAYGVFLRRIAESKHQSCLVLTSREPFSDIAKLQRSRRPAFSLKIEGLDPQVAREILRSEGLTDEHRWSELLESYLGNPSAIELVASRIKGYFNGSVANFLKFKTTLASEIFREALAQQFCTPGRLTYLEKQIMLYLAEKMVEIPGRAILFSNLVSDLKALAKKPISISEIIEALDALRERSLIEVRKDEPTGELLFELQPVVKSYVIKERVGLFGASVTAFNLPKHSAGFAT